MAVLAILVIISFSMLTTARLRENFKMNAFKILAEQFSLTTLSRQAMNYTVTRIINETLTLHKNTRFLLEVIGEGNDSTLYMTINEPITEEDDLLIDIVAERFDGIKFPVPNNPMKLCEMLAEERTTEPDSYIQQLRVSRVFNMEGEICPILPGKRKIIPYMFPKNVTLSHDLGCGTFNYNIGLTTTDSNGSNKYLSLISSITTVHMMADSCSNTLM